MKKGFTLIEIMVSVSIFAIVMAVSTASILGIIDANYKAQALKSVMDNLNLALEEMSRQIGDGITYHCGVGDYTTVQDCSLEPLNQIAFEPRHGSPSSPSDQVIYRRNYDGSGRGYIEKSFDAGGTFFPITAPEIDIKTLKFYVHGSDLTDAKQPRVFMIVDGTASIKDKVKTEFFIQTSVSQSYIDG
ncbi:MAG: prepilin-type N-terminal cleavage/methylation domain-containing protein [bacterium]|nr:prepilin-type N-terminal cleavage/methylation domain-containing protein [bacterium]